MSSVNCVQPAFLNFVKVCPFVVVCSRMLIVVIMGKSSDDSAC